MLHNGESSSRSINSCPLTQSILAQTDNARTRPALAFVPLLLMTSAAAAGVRSWRCRIGSSCPLTKRKSCGKESSPRDIRNARVEAFASCRKDAAISPNCRRLLVPFHNADCVTSRNAKKSQGDQAILVHVGPTGRSIVMAATLVALVVTERHILCYVLQRTCVRRPPEQARQQRTMHPQSKSPQCGLFGSAGDW